MEQQLYGWVEPPSQAVGCIDILLKIIVYLISQFSYDSYGCAFDPVYDNGFMWFCRLFISCINFHLELCRCI